MATGRYELQGDKKTPSVFVTMWTDGGVAFAQREDIVNFTPDQVRQLRAALGVDADLAAELKRQIATERNLYQAKLLSLENDKADLLAACEIGLQAADALTRLMEKHNVPSGNASMTADTIRAAIAKARAAKEE